MFSTESSAVSVAAVQLSPGTHLRGPFPAFTADPRDAFHGVTMDSGSRRRDGRLVDRVARICARGQDPLELLERVAAAVRTHVPYVSAGWLLVDPDTLLITGVYEEGVPREAHLALIQVELTEDDVTKFVDLARSATPAAALSAATHGHLDRSVRWSRIYQPAGFGDELRTVFRTGSVAWGQACLTRAADDPWYTPREVDLLARLSPHVAHGIRAGLLLQEAESPSQGTSAPRLVVLSAAIDRPAGPLPITITSSMPVTSVVNCLSVPFNTIPLTPAGGHTPPGGYLLRDTEVPRNAAGLLHGQWTD